MAQLQKGTTYTTGSTVTAANLNSHVSAAILLDGAVSDQTALGASPASDDVVLISDTDAATLKSATTTELLSTELAAWVGKGASGGTAALQIDGVDKLSVDSGGDTTVAGDLAVTGALTVTGAGLMPAGAITQYGGAAAPTGWLLCDGTEYPEASYAALFTAIGSTYNTGGETTDYFRVPDFKGRVAAGVDSSAGRITSDNTIGASSGEEDHTLTEAQLAAHTHTIKTYTKDNDSVGVAGYAPSGTNQSSPTGSEYSGDSVQSTGSGTAFNILQPYLVVQYIIKT